MALQEFQRDYKAVAASQTDAALGPGSGLKNTDGDVIEKLIIIPTSTSPGVVSIRDGLAGTSITIFNGGASSVASLAPIVVNLGARAKGTASIAPRWLVTTGANVAILAVGRFG